MATSPETHTAPAGQPAPDGRPEPATPAPARPQPSPPGPPAPRPQVPPRLQAPPPTRADKVHKWLAHPLLVLMVGALVTGVLVPTFTGRYQNHQTAQDMKTQVIGDVTNAVSIPMTQLDATHTPVLARSNSPQTSPGSITATYSAFLAKAATVGSEVMAYFPSQGVPTHWNNLVGLVHNFYLFTYATDLGQRQQYLKGIKGYFDFHHVKTGINWGALATGNPNSGSYRSSWVTLEKLILGVRDQLNAAIMGAPTPQF